MRCAIGEKPQTPAETRLRHSTRIRRFNGPAGFRIGQVVALLGFVVVFFIQEKRLLRDLAPLPRPFAETRFLDAMREMQILLFPDRFWHLFVPLALVAAALLVCYRIRWFLLAGAGLAASLMLVADRMYFNFFSSVVSSDSFRAAPQLWRVRHSVLAAFETADLIFFLIFAGFGGYAYFFYRWTGRHPQARFGNFVWDKSAAAVFGMMALHAGWVAFTIPVNDLRLDMSGTIVRPEESQEVFTPLFESSHKDFAITFGVLNFHLKDFLEAVPRLFEDREVNQRDLDMVVRLLEEKKKLNDRPSPFFGIARGRNVILVSLEAFQHFLLDLEFEGQAVTPTLNRLKDSAISFDYILDNVGAGGTSDAEFSVLTGLMPDTRQMAALSHLSRNRMLALPASLKKEGYETLSMHGNDRSFWNRGLNHPRLGIDRLLFREAFPDEALGMGVPDQVFFQRAGEILRERNSPFFAYLITLTSHHPYHEVPENFRNRGFGKLPRHTLASDYLRAAAYTDRALEGFIQSSKTSGLWEQSLIVLYGDHIAPMADADRKLMASAIGTDPGSVRAMRVPLLILVPGKETEIQANRDAFASTIGGLQDLFPTVLHLLGLEIPFGLTGTHLFVPNPQRHAINLPRRTDSYVFNGLVYSSILGEVVTDEHGPVFFGDPESVTQKERQKNYAEASSYAFLHQHLFDFDSQYLARKAKGLE